MTTGRSGATRAFLAPLRTRSRACQSGKAPLEGRKGSRPVNRVGARNSLTDVPGLKVGNAEDHKARSGATVILPDRPAVAAVDLRGGGTGTRETDLLDPAATVEAVDAIALSGGSAFGLDAAGGVMAWLAGQGLGFAVGPARVPIVPSAIIFDLLNGGDKDWGEPPPYRRLGQAAAAAAGDEVLLGNVGAGLGASAGALKGGLGSASVVHESGITVAALAVVNAHGEVVMPESRCFWAWALERDGELGGQAPPEGDHPRDRDFAFPASAGRNTTLTVVATDATLSVAQARRVAIMAQDGLARAISPAHSPLDGDTVFVLSTGQQPLGDPIAGLARVGQLAADCTARAIMRGVYEAESLGDLQSYRDRFGP